MVFLRRNLTGRQANTATILALAASTAACSMHPLPENVSRASTFDIVERIRCEVKEALDAFRGDRHADRIIAVSAIGYDFDFNMSEGNHIKNGDAAGANLKWDRPSFKDKSKGFSLDVTARAEKTRSNIRRFRIIENLAELKGQMDCSNATTRANRVYPITGATGLGEVVTTFIKLEKLSDFPRVAVTDPKPPISVAEKNVVFSDVLKFTTRLSAGVKPTLTLSTVAGDLRLTNASIFGSAERNDVHALIVALASDPKEDPDVLAKLKGAKEMMAFRAKRAFAAARREQLVERGLVSDERVATALIQKDQDARNRVLIELQRLRDLEDDEREAPRLLGERFLEIMRLP